MSLVVFSDLDGTLLDHDTYSWQEAVPALEALKSRRIPLILCSSKTRAEMLPLQEELGIREPLISENGGAVFAPQGHPLAGDDWQDTGDGWRMKPLGRPVAELRRVLEDFKRRFGARGFGDMSDREVAWLTGLSLDKAALARRREFNEPVWLPEPEVQGAEFMAAARAAGLEVTRGGRFFHLLGGGDKGKAVRLVLEIMRRQDPALVSLALGDAENDLPMLKAVDLPVLVARPDGGHAELELPGLVKTELPGPAGWNQAVLQALTRWEAS